MADLLFSESWHLVATQRIALRPNLVIRRQSFRGEPWYVLGDPYSNRFYRFRPEAYQFISRLDGKKTVEEVWNDCLRADPDRTPGQQEVVSALAQLHAASLIVSDLPPDAAALFNRMTKRQAQNLRQVLLNFLFLKIPLWDPDSFLNKTSFIGKFIFSRYGLILFAVALFWALRMGADRWQELLDQTNGILSPGNLLWLYVTWGVVKFFHEMGHGYATKRYGGEVHTMGIMFLVFTPVPYVDTTASWGFRERWKRVMVGFAGMLVEFFIAAVALTVWANTGPGTINQIAFNVIFLASVSTLLFNINPLLRFDGYYIMSDALDVPNLQQTAFLQLKTALERYGFGLRRVPPVANTKRGAFWYGTYGLAAAVYRVFLLGTIVFFIGQKLFGLGIALAIFGLITWGVVPLVKMFSYVFTEPRLDRVRSRAIGVVYGTVGVVIAFLAFFPWPAHFRAEGVVKAENVASFVNFSDGILVEVNNESSAMVKAGQPLLKMVNPLLDAELQSARARVEQFAQQVRLAQAEDPVNIGPLEASLRAANAQLNVLIQREKALQVSAPIDGRWFAPFVYTYRGAWVPRGTFLGEVVDESSFYFSAIVTQKEAASLFSENIRNAEIRLRGEAETKIRSYEWRTIAADQLTLPTPSLGWGGGGPVEVKQDDDEGLSTVEPFFEVRVALDGQEPPSLFHLRSGKVRFELEPRPLLVQWWRWFRQLLQERYKI